MTDIIKKSSRPESVINISYSKRMLWAKPFLQSVKALLPMLRIARIETLRYNGRPATVYGLCVRDPSTGRFTIRVRVRGSSGYLHHYEVIEALAHELAHTRYWDHCPEHLKLAARLQIKFGRVLKKHGFISMEKQPKFFKEMQDYALELEAKKKKK